jgi:predicted anti-sigma-YlaC factor YlaD
MIRNAHDEAGKLITLGEGLPDAQQGWLRAHLEECSACRDYAEAANWVVRTLRSLPLAADFRLVRATQMRVRQRALELQWRQERLWVVCVCCVAVTVGTALTTAVLWRGLAWMEQLARLSGPAWQIGLVALGLMPAIVVGILLLARGTHLADYDGSLRG